MTTIAFIGAGSTVFAKNLLGDILSFPELADATIKLMDIDPQRLRTTQLVAERIARAVGAHPQKKNRPATAAAFAQHAFRDQPVSDALIGFIT